MDTPADALVADGSADQAMWLSALLSAPPIAAGEGNQALGFAEYSADYTLPYCNWE